MLLQTIKNNRILQNAGWIIVCKIIQSILSIVITVISARFLGPSNYGVLSYASSVVAFVAPISLLGLGNIQVQEYINYPSEEGKILGSSLVLSLLSSFVCMLGVACFAYAANENEPLVVIVCFLYSFVLLFQSLELVVYWFQAKLLSKYSSIVSLIAYVLVSFYKVLLLMFRVDVVFFAISNALDYAIISLVLLYLFKAKTKSQITFDWQVAKRALNKSKHYIIPNLMIVIFTQTDFIMLKHIIGQEATGLYSAASTCAWVGSFIYTALLDSGRPSIFENYKKSEYSFNESVIKLYCAIIWFGVLMGAVVSGMSSILIDVLYGGDYISASSSLAVLAWLPLVSNMGAVRNIWVLAKNRQKYLWVINLGGALSNVFLNIFLIPTLGILGAAFASLASQIFTNIIITFVFRPYRDSFYLMVSGFNPKHILGYLLRRQ